MEELVKGKRQMGLRTGWERACAPGVHRSVLVLATAAQPADRGKVTGTPIRNSGCDGHSSTFYSTTFYSTTYLLHYSSTPILHSSPLLSFSPSFCQRNFIVTQWKKPEHGIIPELPGKRTWQRHVLLNEQLCGWNL